MFLNSGIYFLIQIDANLFHFTFKPSIFPDNQSNIRHTTAVCVTKIAGNLFYLKLLVSESKRVYFITTLFNINHKHTSKF